MQRIAAVLIIIFMLCADFVFAQNVFLVAGDEYISVISCIDGVRMSVYHEHIKEISYNHKNAEISSVLIPESMGSVWVSSQCFTEEDLGALIYTQVVFTDGNVVNFTFNVDADLLKGYKKIQFVRKIGNSQQTFTLRAVNNRVYHYSLTRPPKTEEFDKFKKISDIQESTKLKGKIVPIAPFQGDVVKK